MLVWVIAGLAILGFIGAIAGFSLLSRQGSRRVAQLHSDSERLETYVGGFRSRRMNATIPLARLDLFPWGVRLGGSASFLKKLIPTWEAEYVEIQEVQVVKSPLGTGGGVRLRSAVPGGPIVFWEHQ